MHNTMTKELKIGLIVIFILASIFIIIPFLFERINPIISYIYSGVGVLGLLHFSGLIRLKKINIDDDKNI